MRVGNGGRVETGFVRAGVEQPSHIIYRSHPAPHGQWDEYLRGHRFDHVQDQATIVAGGCDIQKGELIRALLVVTRSNLHRIARVAQLNKVDTFDDTATGDVKAGDDSFS